MNFTSNIAEEENMDFVNLPVDQLRQYTLKSILDSEPVWFAADIGKENDRKNGILAIDVYDYNSLYGLDINLSKKDRVLCHYSIPNHAMVFVGADTNNNGEVVKFRVENSWGTDTGKSGYWAMYSNWFDAYVFNVIIHKKYIPENVLKLLDTEPVNIPAWDPFYTSFMK
jgi:bleomycin hydrolase